MKKTGSNSFLLDTNIIIDLFQGEKGIADRIEGSYITYIPIPVLGELYFGAETSQRKAYHTDQIQKLLKVVELLNTSDITAKIYGKIKSKLKLEGTPIPENDVWIAAMAIEYNLPLVTRDNHFTKITELSLESW